MTIDPKPITAENVERFRVFLACFKDHAQFCAEGCEWTCGDIEDRLGSAIVGEYCDTGQTLLEWWLRQ